MDRQTDQRDGKTDRQTDRQTGGGDTHRGRGQRGRRRWGPTLPSGRTGGQLHRSEQREGLERPVPPASPSHSGTGTGQNGEVWLLYMYVDCFLYFSSPSPPINPFPPLPSLPPSPPTNPFPPLPSLPFFPSLPPSMHVDCFLLFFSPTHQPPSLPPSFPPSPTSPLPRPHKMPPSVLHEGGGVQLVPAALGLVAVGGRRAAAGAVVARGHAGEAVACTSAVWVG